MSPAKNKIVQMKSIKKRFSYNNKKTKPTKCRIIPLYTTSIPIRKASLTYCKMT